MVTANCVESAMRPLVGGLSRVFFGTTAANTNPTRAKQKITEARYFRILLLQVACQGVLFARHVRGCKTGFAMESEWWYGGVDELLRNATHFTRI
jgi:hypothetical protein